MAKLRTHRAILMIGAILLLSVISTGVRADNKDDEDDKSFSTFVKFLKSNYNAKGQSTFGMVTFARFLVKVIKPAGVKNFKVSILRDLQFTNLKVDDDLGTFIRKNVHTDWQPMTQVVSLKDNQYIYVYFMLEKKDAKFLVVAVQQKEAFVVQFKFEPEQLAKFIENPEIMGISLNGDDKKNRNNSDPGDPVSITDDANVDADATKPPADAVSPAGSSTDDKKVKPATSTPETKPEAKPENKSETKPETKPEAKPEVKPEAKPETPAKKPPVLIRKPDTERLNTLQ